MSQERLRVLFIGAHPDDCEGSCGGTGAKLAARGHTVRFLSVTNGESGHHEIGGAPLVQRRIAEAKAAAELAGIESQVLPIPDGHLEPTLENRLRLIRVMREFQADFVFTNRPNDYHPDHRYTSQLVQDSAFSVTVPHIAPEVPGLARNPVFLYWWDGFQKPYPFQAAVALNIDDVLDIKIRMIHAHTSQFYEWLPWHAGVLDQVPSDDAERLEWLRERISSHRPSRIAEECREQLIARYGEEKGAAIRCAEAFETCEYGAPFSAAEEERVFGGL